MPTLADLVASYTRTPSARCYLDGKRWYGVQKLSSRWRFKEQIETGSVEGRNPPVVPRINMEVRWSWGYNGVEVAGFRGLVSDTFVASYPNTDRIACSGVLWLADQNNEVLQTDPLNDIKASVAAKYLLTHYGDIPASRIHLPVLPASGAAWAGSEWTLGTLTPVQWGDPDQQSGGTTAMKAAAEIYGCMGYWLYALPDGTITAKAMERKPSTTAREVFRRDLNLLVNGAPERVQSYQNVFNQSTTRGGYTGVEGAQLYDQYRTTHPLLSSGVYRDFGFASELLEYENATDAGAASVTEVTKRILNVVSRLPDVVPLRAKADPNRKVGDTVGIIDIGIRIPTQRNFFIYQIERTLDLLSGAFDDNLLLDGGTGNSGYTTVPPPDAGFTWSLMRETLDGVDVVEVALDGSGSSSPTGEIVSWSWSTSTPVLAGTSSTATGVTATLFFEAADSPAEIALTVLDTTAKTSERSAPVDLTGADSVPPFTEVVSAAAGSAWLVTPDGGATWNAETGSGDAIAVGTIGAGADDRAPASTTPALLSTRGSGGAGGLRQTVDALATASTNLVSNSGAITSNIWVNESTPLRVWFAIGTAVYRSIDGGATKVAMAAAPATVSWIMEDAAVENSVFLLAGADMLNATDPTVGWALLYAGPVGATARQFVRSRDGQVTWICYTGAPAGEALQRVENGAAADLAATDVRTLALDRDASSLRATVYGVTGDDPAQIWSFDGLTGLSAVESSQTFPAGATVQHMLSSRQFDVIYCADFDSVSAGQGALRKYFPQADLLLLWKELDSGQQGHMLGLGAHAVGPGEILRMSIGVDPGGVWHYRDGHWTFRPLPVSGTVRGIAIAADPFNPDRWLAIFNNTSTGCVNSSGVLHGDSWAHSPAWYTEDAGVTWTEVVVPTPAGFVSGSFVRFVAWSDQFANVWTLPFAYGSGPYSAIITGTGTTVTRTVESTAFSAPELVPGVDSEWVYSTDWTGADGIGYLNAGGTPQTPSGASPADLHFGALERMPGTSRVVFLAEGPIWVTSDYRASQPTALLPSAGASAVSATATAIYYNQAANLWRVDDPLGAATAVLVTSGDITTYPRVDRQSRTLGAVSLGADVLIDDGVTAITITGPAASSLLSGIDDGAFFALEIIVRGV